MRKVVDVAYRPTLLRGMEAICAAFGVGMKTVRRWAQEGAPIVVEGQGNNARYSLEMARLQAWREQRCQNAAKSAAKNAAKGKKHVWTD